MSVQTLQLESKCNIPKIIFQTWKTKDLPEHWKESPEAIKKYFPDWKYVFHTDEDNRNFIKDNYNWFLPTYDNYPYGIMRADSVRYFFLYHYGGLYIDTDIVPTSNFEHLFTDNKAEVYLPLTENITSFTNCIMASKKGAEIWKIMFKVLMERSNWFIPIPHFAVIFKTGPMCLDGAVHRYKGVTALLPCNMISQNMTNPEIKDNTYTKAIQGRSWNRWDSHFIGWIYINRKILIILGLALIIYFFKCFFEYRQYYIENH
jgi:mannosyltransferase OCH1-like enzyme